MQEILGVKWPHNFSPIAVNGEEWDSPFDSAGHQHAGLKRLPCAVTLHDHHAFDWVCADGDAHSLVTSASQPKPKPTRTRQRRSLRCTLANCT